jgi:hypothetical protein
LKLNRFVYFFQYFPEKLAEKEFSGRFIGTVGMAAGLLIWLGIFSKYLEGQSYEHEISQVLWFTLILIPPSFIALKAILLSNRRLIKMACLLSVASTTLATGKFVVAGHSLVVYLPLVLFLISAGLNISKPLTKRQKKELECLITEHARGIEQETEEKIRDASNLEYLINMEISLYQTTPEIACIYLINGIAADKIKENYERYRELKGLRFANVYRLGIFYVLARTNGIWDLKQTLGEHTTYRFKGSQKTGEYIGNHHYGYMGKAIGLSSRVLRVAAGMYQIYSGTSKWKFALSYFDDPLDSKAIMDGCIDYDVGHHEQYPS